MRTKIRECIKVEIDFFENIGLKIEETLPDFRLDDWLQEIPTKYISPQEWYGDYYIENIDKSIYFEHAFQKKHFCSICQEEDIAINLVTLDCGHLFHFKTSECLGLFEWIKTKNIPECPVCRKYI